jgi:hypothetical protein
MSAASLKANEPSMEEILASIRRIIADDAGKDAAAPDEPAAEKASAPEPAAAPAEDEDEDVLDLALVAAEPLVKIDLEPLPQSVELDEDIEFRVFEEPLVASVAPEPEPVAAAPPPPPPPPPAPEPAPPEMLLSPQVDATVALAFQSLASTLVPNNARTLEDIVKDMMRPMLKSWLDEHLPGVVERLVKAEIERVARGQRG